ncbi:MAG: hypothetical protein JW939_03855, partial [Candidatus Thermoplasmatota archaeon]|nr:hypothetical protein [Candidatus Thermoplasmatota archaeon]
EEEHPSVDMEPSSISDGEAGAEGPILPTFKRPNTLPGEEKDEFIVERIMELKEMLAEGEIDQEMYETLRNRLVNQLDS